MFGRKEKGEERKGWREKGGESGDMCVWYGEKRGRKGKMGGKKCGWDPPISFLPKVGGNGRERKGQVFGQVKITILSKKI